MRRLSILPLLLGVAATCSALALAELHLGAPAGAAHPAPQMSTADATLRAPHPLPVTELTPAAETVPLPTAIAEVRAALPVDSPPPPPADPPPASAPPTAASPEPVAALPASVSQPIEVEPVHDKVVALLAAMNAARTASGLQPLNWSPALAEVALVRARDLLANGYFDHYGPDGRSAFSELAARGIRYGLAGENLARNNYAEARTVEAAFQGLMASPGHRANILEPQFTSVGVAAVRSGRTWLYVTVFTD